MIPSKLLPYKAAITFILKVLLLFASWSFLFDLFILNSKLDNLITLNLASLSVGTLQFLGFQASQDQSTVLINNLPLVLIGNPCNAFAFFGLFTCFVIAYPARLIHKLWFIPVGILFIHLLNVVRVMLLALNLWYNRESFEFNHKYTFIMFLYGLTFLLWMAWIKRFSHTSFIPTKVSGSPK